MIYPRIILSACLLSFSVLLSAQNFKTIEKTYVYRAQRNESPEQAERNAVNCARLEGLRETFGTIVSGASATSLISKNNITDSKFVYLGSEGEVNGEWVADLEPPKVETTLEDGVLCVKATVRFKGKEIESAKVNFEAKILRNVPEVEYESSEFTAGNKIFVHFSSPVDGYLAIYLLDGETAYCLLPYRGNGLGYHKIVHGREYILFSRQRYDQDENLDEIDGYTLTTEGNHQDLNQLYFIFSPNRFYKAKERRREKKAFDKDYPRELSWTDFQKWILKQRRDDKEMSVQTKYVVISPLKGMSE